MSLPESPAFYQALYEATKAALACYPAEIERIRRAVDLVERGQVQPTDIPGEWDITSSDQTSAYRVNGTCQCRDYPKAPGGRCKHRWALALHKRVQKTLTSNPWHVVHSVELRDQLAGITTAQETVEMPTTDRFGKLTGKKTAYTHTVHTLPRDPDDDTLTMPQSLTALVCSAEYGHRNGGQFCTTAGR